MSPSAFLAGLSDWIVGVAATMVVLASFYKIRPVHRFVRRNTVDLFAEKVEEILHPLHAKIDRNERQLQEIADALGYQFRPNGGNSLRDRVDGLYQHRSGGGGG